MFVASPLFTIARPAAVPSSTFYHPHCDHAYIKKRSPSPPALMDYYSFGSPYSGYDPAYEAELDRREYAHRLRLAQAQEAAAREQAFRQAQQQQQRNFHSHAWPESYSGGYPVEEPWAATDSDDDDTSAYGIPPSYGLDTGRPHYASAPPQNSLYGDQEPLPENIYRRASPPLPPVRQGSPARHHPVSSFGQQARNSKLAPSNISTSRNSSRGPSPAPSPSFHRPSTSSASAASASSPAQTTAAAPPAPSGPTPAERIAARRLQRFWRTRSGIKAKLKDLKAIEQQFRALQQDYVAPSSPVVDPKTGKLAFCKENTAVHAYVDALEKLQVRLDGVDSGGFKEVRDRRKAVIVAIEKELQAVEQWKTAVCSGSSSAAKSASAQHQQQQSHSLSQPGQKDEYGLEDLSHESEDPEEHVW